MTSSPTEDSDTRNPPTMGESSIPVTPKNSHSSPRSYSSFDSPNSPLFSHEDQIEIHRKRQQLEVDISALEHQQKILQKELQSIKQNIVSQGELIHLKAQTQTRISEKQTSQHTQLIDDYVEIMRHVRAAEASIAVIEQKIKEENERRNSILEENSAVLNALDFSKSEFVVPKINSVDPSYNPSVKFDLERFVHHLQETNDDNTSLGNVNDLLPLQANAAKEITKSLEVESTLRSIGTSAIRQEIQMNQKILATLEAQIKTNELENEKKREMLEKRKDSMNEEIVYHEAQFGIAKDSFDQQIQQMNNETDYLKSKIADSSALFDKIVDETKVVVNEMQNRVYATEEESDNEVIYDYQDYSQYSTQTGYSQYSMSSLLEDKAVLQARKKQLKEEIDEINDRIRDMKRKGLKKESEKKAQITAINEKYKANKAILAKESKQRSQNSSISSNSSNLSKNLEMLISKIDDSLNEMKSDLQ